MQDEEMTEEEHQELMQELAMQGAERSMAAQSDAIIGVVGAGVFTLSSFNSTGGLIAGAIGIAGIAFFISGLRKRSSFWSILLGIPTVIILLWKMTTVF